jgi:hypothetical protein
MLILLIIAYCAIKPKNSSSSMRISALIMLISYKLPIMELDCTE